MSHHITTKKLKRLVAYIENVGINPTRLAHSIDINLNQLIKVKPDNNIPSIYYAQLYQQKITPQKITPSILIMNCLISELFMTLNHSINF